VYSDLSDLITLNGTQITRFFTTDAKALSHILMNTSLYEKPEMARYALARILGDGETLRQRSVNLIAIGF